MKTRITVALLALVALFAIGEIIAAQATHRASFAVEYSIQSHRMLPDQEEAIASMKAALRTMDRTRSLLLWLPEVGAVAALGIVWWLYASFATPLIRLRDAAYAVGHGNLNHLVEAKGKDEFADLSRAFNQMTLRLREAHERLRQSARLAALGDVASGVAHNFGNLLTVIQGNAEILRVDADRIDAPAQLPKRIDLILQETERGGTIIRRLHAFARGGSGELGPVNLSEVVDTAVTIASAHPHARRVQLTATLPKGIPPVRGNAEELEEVLINILINACQAMPDGGTVTIKAGKTSMEALGDERTGKIVWLSITDTGCGISPDALRHIFEPFFTQRLPGMEPGTGLGLSSSLGMVRRMGGDIKVKSQVGAGSVFTIFLPEWRQVASVPNSPAAQASFSFDNHGNEADSPRLAATTGAREAA